MFEEGSWLEQAQGVPDLHPWSSIDAFKKRLRELGVPIGGNRSRNELFTKWQKAEKEKSLELQIEKSLEERRRAGKPSAAGDDPTPKTLPVPVRPSDAEVALHNLTHFPPAAWCLCCVRAKAR